MCGGRMKSCLSCVFGPCGVHVVCLPRSGGISIDWLRCEVRIKDLVKYTLNTALQQPRIPEYSQKEIGVTPIVTHGGNSRARRWS